MEKISAKEKERHLETAETIDDRTAVPTPERVESVDEKQDRDIEKAVAEQKDGLPAPIEIPDGGWKAWLTVLGAWCILFSTFGMTNAFGVYQDYYVRFYLPSYSPSTIGWIGSTQLFFQFSMGFFAGKAFDAGYFYHIVSLASLLYIFAYYMLSLAHQDAFYQVFLSQGVAAGIALGFLFLPAIGVIAHHFRRRRSFAMGIVISGSSCGGLVFPVMLNKLIAAGGFAQATRGVAYLCTGMMALAVLLMRTRLPPPSKAKAQGNAPPVPLPTIKELVTDTRYMLATAGAFFNIIGIFAPIFYMQLYAVVHGVDQNLAFYTITILNGASVIGRILPNFLGDIWGPFNAILVCTFGCAVLIFSMLAATNAGGIIAIAVLYGLFSGAYVSLISPLFASLANNLAEIGIRLGFAFTIVAFAGLIGTPISGALLTEDLLWARPLCFSGACMIVGFSCLFASRHITARQKGTWRV
ncbi:hypothetical protein M408DRAFT_331736 [Serendipita vermifera MAFF 305830]|uniref:Major facilitator superfamily (MFS) profile domain-containing protein n=1 Tax=Serendipita vermifera MAFF 305830 TaxID=933852 RepID=A0A0C2X586_SERVB|nr:hypothetical protein M408DRAFT_331736 [Serendipita vermifera MAFF 305830]